MTTKSPAQLATEVLEALRKAMGMLTVEAGDEPCITAIWSEINSAIQSAEALVEMVGNVPAREENASNGGKNAEMLPSGNRE